MACHCSAASLLLLLIITCFPSKIPFTLKPLENNELVTYLAECNYDAKDDWDKNIYKNPAFWVYRIPVTLTHMKHTFQREVLTTKYNMQYPLLRLFFELVSKHLSRHKKEPTTYCEEKRID